MKLKSNQIPKLVELLESGREKNSDVIPRIDKDKLETFLQYGVFDPKTLIAVNKDVTAVLILRVMPDLFSNRQSIKDLVWYSENPGQGVRLLKEAKEWVDAWGDSVYNAFLSTTMNDERADKLIERVGLIKIGTTFSFKGDW